MARHHVNNFPPGTYVEHVGKDWIGTVRGITVNPHGEPILVIDATYIFNGTAANETFRIHPNNVNRLNEDTLLTEDKDEND